MYQFDKRYNLTVNQPFSLCLRVSIEPLKENQGFVAVRAEPGELAG
jgi:hypothetical protein